MNKQNIYILLLIIVTAIFLTLISIALYNSSANTSSSSTTEENSPTEKENQKAAEKSTAEEKFGNSICTLEEYKSLGLDGEFKKIFESVKVRICKDKEKPIKIKREIMVTYDDLKNKISQGIYRGIDQVSDEINRLYDFIDEENIPISDLFEVDIKNSIVKKDLYSVNLIYFKPKLDLKALKFCPFSAFFLYDGCYLLAFAYGEKGEINGMLIAHTIDFASQA